LNINWSNVQPRIEVFLKNKIIVFFNSYIVSTFAYCRNKNTCYLTKSTLLLKIECRDTHIYMKTECLQTKWNAALFGGGKGKDRFALIKSFIYPGVKRGAWGVHCKRLL